MATTTGIDSREELRRAAVKHLWMHNRGWSEMAERGEPVVMTGGEGVHVTDNTGKRWLDVNGGYMSVNIGYGRTEVADAAYEQMKSLAYFPQATTTEPVARLAQKLAEITPGDLSRTFFVSGGSEANETSIKIARAYQQRVGEPGRYKIISRKASYHGALGLTTWLGGPPSGSTRSDYGPEFPGMIYVPQPNPYRCEYGGQTPSECAELCAKAVEDAILFHGPQTVAAMIAEPVSVPASVAVPGDEYWPMLREICDRYGVMLIADEVITGFGRTGKMFSVEHWGVVPDLMSVAKGIVSSYMPLGGSIARESIADAFAGGDESRFLQHVLTFAGHPVPAAASLKNLEILESERMVENSAEMGAYFLDGLREIGAKHPMIGNVSGLGLLVGIDLVKDRDTKEAFPKSAKVAERLIGEFEKRSLILRPSDTSITMGPPLCITRGEVDEIVTGVDEALGEVERQLAVRAD